MAPPFGSAYDVHRMLKDGARSIVGERAKQWERDSVSHVTRPATKPSTQWFQHCEDKRDTMIRAHASISSTVAKYCDSAESKQWGLNGIAGQLSGPTPAQATPLSSLVSATPKRYLVTDSDAGLPPVSISIHDLSQFFYHFIIPSIAIASQQSCSAFPFE